MIMEGTDNAMFQLDTLIGAEYLENLRRKTHLEPETSLMFAVLSDALDDYRKYAIDQSTRGRRLFRQVDGWIQEKNCHWLFSFESICDCFELDPDFLRKGLRQWREESLKTATLSHVELKESQIAIAS